MRACPAERQVRTSRRREEAMMRPMSKATVVSAALIGILFCSTEAAQQKSGIKVVPLREAQKVFATYKGKLPEDLTGEAMRSEDAWRRHVAEREKLLEERLEEGELDTLANLTLFGTSFTDASIITAAELQQLAANAPSESRQGAEQNYQKRLKDLAIGLAYPQGNERLQYMSGLLQRRGFKFATASDYNRLGEFLARNVLRMLSENARYREAIEKARALDAKSEFEARSHVFEQRGISLDTSLFPNYAIEQALKELKDKGILRAGQVRRVAVVGPGLDTVNKDVGFDYYPEQTIQPFSVADSLLRLGLARENKLSVVTLDISEKVNSHIREARRRALARRAYVLQLPLRMDGQPTDGAVAYWKAFGTRIGRAVPAIPAPKNAGNIETRAIGVFPSIVLKVHPEHLDIVYERMELPEGEKFDLIIGTNIFVYYSEFEQGLAETNLRAMLNEGGLVLTNDALPLTSEGSALKVLGSTATAYSDAPGDGDTILWLESRRTPD